jgi:hypothetical protein
MQIKRKPQDWIPIIHFLHRLQMETMNYIRHIFRPKIIEEHQRIVLEEIEEGQKHIATTFRIKELAACRVMF